jgi:cytochrome d ubiquinol oxidase subunit II
VTVQTEALLLAGGYFALFALTAGVEFGAGLLQLIARVGGHEEAALLADAAVSPVWEVSNVFLIMFALALASFFPRALRAYGETLLMPVGTALFLLLARYVTFGFRHALAQQAWPLWVYGIAGFLAPLPLMAFLPVSEGIGVDLGPDGTLQLAGLQLLLNPFTLALLFATAASEVALAGTLLAAFCARRQRPRGAAFYRAWARAGVAVAFLGAVALGLTLLRVEPWHAAQLGRIWPLPAAVVPLAVVTLRGLGRPGREVASLATLLLAYLAGLLAYAISHLPWLVHPVLTVADALNNGPMLAALVPVFAGGLVASLPLAVWVYVLLPLRVPLPGP